MKKLTTIVALALLAVAGTGYAVTCAFDNVPAATLLVPYWRVSTNGTVGADIPAGGIDTLCAITNVSGTGIIVHATIWNKYSKAVLDWNIPLSGWDTAYWSMRDVLNGNLNNNPTHQVPPGPDGIDVCGANQLATSPTAANSYAPWPLGFGKEVFIRFSNPISAQDAWGAIGYYKTPAFTGNFREKVWDALDEGGDVTSFVTPAKSTAAGTPGIVIDYDNDVCGGPRRDRVYTGDFTGYLTLDVSNYCSRYFPNEMPFYINDAIATRGWNLDFYTPNTIIGDVFYTDAAATAGQVSGDVMIPLEFDVRLQGLTAGTMDETTFYGRFWDGKANPDLGNQHAYSVRYGFIGDGREPLQNRFAYRFYNLAANQAEIEAGPAQTWLIVWRGDRNYANNTMNDDLCNWYSTSRGASSIKNTGFFDATHMLEGDPSVGQDFLTWNLDEEQYSLGECEDPGPSGCPQEGTYPDLWVFLETQRIALLGNTEINPAGYKMGWTDITFPGYDAYNQSYIGVQHTGEYNGLRMGNPTFNVGHQASIVTGQFLCDIFTESGNISDTFAVRN